ncbi:uncharacterized protein LOC143616727 [Bidens hawaiensis]|uniref:uncharacterized protein LOC143616727 n=1 Tax=Bidens hawaiensis TaxID=980011 RepID=UPI0040490B5B
MEQKLPIITNKVWSMVKVIFFMMKKGTISKRKFMLHFNMMMKRHKIGGKSFATPKSGEYEFSCTRKPRNKCHRLANSNPPLAVDEFDDITIDPAVIMVLNMITTTAAVKSPMVEQLIAQGNEDGQVDEAADKFLRRFYNDLRRENI